jgi:hypothetical protein
LGHSLRDKLMAIDRRFSNRWVALFLVGVIQASLLAGLWPLMTSKESLRTDFVNFYGAATIVRDGNGANLYQAETQAPIIIAILGRNNFDYFLHPPFFALVLAPLANLSYGHAFLCWTLLNVALLGVMPWLLCASIALTARRPYLGILAMIFYPTLTTLVLAQSSIVLTFVLMLSYLFLAKEHDSTAGLVLSLATIKFQYVFVIAGLLLVNKRYRAVTGFVMGTLILLAISIRVVKIRGLVEYFEFLKSYNAQRGYDAHQLALMVNWRGFLGSTGLSNHIVLFSTIGSLALIVMGVYAAVRHGTAKKTDVVLALFVTIAVLASPYTHFQDLTVLLLPLYLTMNAAHAGQIVGWRRDASLWMCALILILPIVLVMAGGHSWQNSRIYLMFPAVLSLAAILAGELCTNGHTSAMEPL